MRREGRGRGRNRHGMKERVGRDEREEKRGQEQGKKGKLGRGEKNENWKHIGNRNRKTWSTTISNNILSDCFHPTIYS